MTFFRRIQRSEHSFCTKQKNTAPKSFEQTFSNLLVHGIRWRQQMAKCGRFALCFSVDITSKRRRIYRSSLPFKESQQHFCPLVGFLFSFQATCSQKVKCPTVVLFDRPMYVLEYMRHVHVSGQLVESVASPKLSDLMISNGFCYQRFANDNKKCR